MALISENMALLIFAAVVIAAALLAWWFGSHTDYEAGVFHTFIAILAGFAIFVTFLFYYNIIILQNQQQVLAGIQEAARINDSVLNSVLDEIDQAASIIPNFVISITPLTNAVCCSNTGFTGSTGATGPTGCNIPVDQDPVNPQTCTEKMTLSYRIFSLWQDIIMSNSLRPINQSTFVVNFLQRANSQQLYVQWTASRLNFNEDTQTFGDLLFEYGLPITVQTPQEYITVSQAVMADPRFQTIFQ
jgi:hypothetical protein